MVLQNGETKIVSGHYHRTRATALMRAKRRWQTVGKDNTGIELKSQIDRMKLTPLFTRTTTGIELSIVHCIQNQSVSSIAGEVLSRTIKP